MGHEAVVYPQNQQFLNFKRSDLFSYELGDFTVV